MPMTQTVSGFYQDFGGIFMVYRRFSATAEFYTWMVCSAASGESPSAYRWGAFAVFDSSD